MSSSSDSRNVAVPDTVVGDELDERLGEVLPRGTRREDDTVLLLSFVAGRRSNGHRNLIFESDIDKPVDSLTLDGDSLVVHVGFADGVDEAPNAKLLLVLSRSAKDDNGTGVRREGEMSKNDNDAGQLGSTYSK